jgi:hypothetical protein
VAPGDAAGGHNPGMEWWRWVEGGTAALLVLALLAMRFDTLKDQRGSSPRRALQRLPPLGLLVPAAFLLGLLGPWWFGLIVIAVPALVMLVGLAS